MKNKIAKMVFGRLFGRVPTQCAYCGRIFLCTRETWKTRIMNASRYGDPCWARNVCDCEECTHGKKTPKCGYVSPEDSKKILDGMDK